MGNPVVILDRTVIYQTVVDVINVTYNPCIVQLFEASWAGKPVRTGWFERT